MSCIVAFPAILSAVLVSDDDFTEGQLLSRALNLQASFYGGLSIRSSITRLHLAVSTRTVSCLKHILHSSFA